jgi:hypothetical protein
MLKRVKLFAPTFFSSAFVSLATLAVDFDSPAVASGACIEKPPPAVAENKPGNVPYNDAICRSCYFTTDVLLWDVRYDPAKGRTCWFLRDAYGRDVTEAHVRTSDAPAPTSTLSSKLASWFGSFNFMRASAKAVPESNVARVSSPDPSRQRQGDTANGKKAGGDVRIGQGSNGVAHAVKRVSRASTHQDERALIEEFEEFLRWRERQRRSGS